MKKCLSVAFLAMMSLATLGQLPKPVSDKLQNIQDASYAYGYAMAVQHLTRDAEGIAFDDFVQGMKDYMDRKAPRVKANKRQELVRFYNKELTKVKAKQFQADSQQMLAKSQAFIKKNSQNQDIQVNDQGIQYQIIQEGTGKAVTMNDVVRLSYTLDTLSGELSQSQRAYSIKASLFKRGWMSVLVGMKAGSTLKVFVPPKPELFKFGSGYKTKAADVQIYNVKVIKAYPFVDEVTTQSSTGRSN